MNGWAASDGSAALGISEEPFQSGEEEIFQNELEAHPEIIPISELNPTATVAIPIGREVSTSVGPLDLLFLDDTGRFVVIETKLIQNQEARREVIAQLLEYGSRISHELDEQRISAVADKYCDALNEARARVASGKGDIVRLTPSALSRRIRDGLRSATKGPILVVAGNKLEERALVLADYLRRQPGPVACVEVRRFRVAGAKLLIGTVRAASLIATLSPSQGAALSRDEWLVAVAEEPLKSIRQDLLEWVEGLEKQELCSLRYGTVDLLIDVKRNEDQTLVLFDIGKESFYIYFDTMRSFAPSDEVVLHLRSNIEAIIGVGHLGAGMRYPSFRLVDLAPVDARTRMKQLLRTVVETIAATSTSG